MKSYQTLEPEMRDHAMILNPNRPDSRNALNAPMFDDLDDFFNHEVIVEREMKKQYKTLYLRIHVLCPLQLQVLQAYMLILLKEALLIILVI